MSNEEIVRFWGEESLVRWPVDLLVGVAVPEEAKRFLVEVGFPRDVDWTMRFEANLEGWLQSKNDSRANIIGYDETACICVDKRGFVICVEPDGKERFVNSNVSLYGEFLVLYQQYRLEVRELNEEPGEGVILRTAQKMKDADPPAFRNIECWWAVILEQMEAGLL